MKSMKEQRKAYNKFRNHYGSKAVMHNGAVLGFPGFKSWLADQAFQKPVKMDK